jgi:hypothetical protein
VKLIYCPACHDVVRLCLQMQRAYICGKAFGAYLDNVCARVGGLAIPLGFANLSFVIALRDRPLNGVGKCFEAFVIPEICPTIEVTESIGARKAES